MRGLLHVTICRVEWEESDKLTAHRSHTISWKVDFMFASGQCHTLDRVNENSTLRHAYDAQLCTDSVRRLALTKDPAFPVPTDRLVFLMVDPHSPVCPRFFSHQHPQSPFTPCPHATEARPEVLRARLVAAAATGADGHAHPREPADPRCHARGRSPLPAHTPCACTPRLRTQCHTGQHNVSFTRHSTFLLNKLTD